MIKGFKGLTLQSTINDSAYHYSEEDDTESDSNSDPKVATHTSDGKKRKVTDTETTNRNSPHKSLTDQLIPVVIPLIGQTNTDGVAASGNTLYVVRTIISKEIVTDAARSTAHVFRNPADVSWHDTDKTTPRDGNTFIRSTSLNYPVPIGGSTTVSPTRTGSQEIISPRGSIGPKEFRNSQPFETSINGIYTKHRDPAPIWSKVIGRKFSQKSSSDVYLRCWMNLTRDTVLTKIPNFMNLGILFIHTFDELWSVFIPTTRIGRPTDGSNWLLPGQFIGEVTAEKSEQDRVRAKL